MILSSLIPLHFIPLHFIPLSLITPLTRLNLTVYRRMNEAANLVERDLTVVGASAIEDKLQVSTYCTYGTYCMCCVHDFIILYLFMFSILFINLRASLSCRDLLLRYFLCILFHVFTVYYFVHVSLFHMLTSHFHVIM
jgi:hypothetical protein